MRISNLVNESKMKITLYKDGGNFGLTLVNEFNSFSIMNEIEDLTYVINLLSHFRILGILNFREEYTEDDLFNDLVLLYLKMKGRNKYIDTKSKYCTVEKKYIIKKSVKNMSFHDKVIFSILDRVANTLSRGLTFGLN